MAEGRVIDMVDYFDHRFRTNVYNRQNMGASMTSEQIEKDTQEFLAKGGSIQQIPMGQTKEWEPLPLGLEDGKRHLDEGV